ncbi:glycoside hydrolase family 13 protein [Nocardioides perillae]|uniref:Alpha-glucosidase n=1 Tax=Nocardioides perillae TaxID=1119534 RepID=A0A7Y9ULX5_9ACTN|nr:glycoside hydrolase family 13 protein [Nocardioides perillae]NYG54821.1 alpha-glucosidase [Nocardioides perillae]
MSHDRDEPQAPGHLLDEPHHDGSPVHLDEEWPALGGTVRVRCRTAASDPVDGVWIRTTYDAEPVFHVCAPRHAPDGSTWWEGDLPVHSPVTHYRFLLATPDGRQRWLTGAGVVEHDVPDASDFRVTTHQPAPDWGRDAVVYQVFPDRFARSAAADEREVPAWAVPAAWDDDVVFEPHDHRTPLQLFGGDLDGVTEHLDHVEAVGATVLYTTPVFPGESNHRYNASTFTGVDPLLGGDAAYTRLSGAVHERGMRILGDLTTNHTGDTHEWFQRALRDPDSEERGYYTFNADGSYECWMGHGTLPKVDHTHPGLRAAFVEGDDSIVARWLRPPFDVDGWRIDVANMTGRLGAVDVNHEVARAVRATAAAVRPDPLVIGEHNHDASGDVDGDGWHGTMNYSGFSWPVWSWLRDPDSPARSFGRPLPAPVRPGPAVLRGLREWQGRLGWRATEASWNILGSHDSARIRTLVRDPAVHRVAAGLQFTLPGVPMVFAGDEIGLEGVTGEDARRPMPWHRRESWDEATLATYAALARLRADLPALRRGGLRWAHASDDALAWLREHPDGSVLVLARRAAGAPVRLPASALGLADGGTAPLLLATEDSGRDLAVAGGHLALPGDGPAFTVWELPAVHPPL